MRPSILWVIFKRELIDLLRDRRTLISLFILPLVAFPLLATISTRAFEAINKKSESEATSVAIKASDAGVELRTAIAKSGLQLIERDDLHKAVESKAASCGAEQLGKRILVYTDNSRQASVYAGRKLRDSLNEVRDEKIKETLLGSGLNEGALKPFAVEPINVA